MYVYKSIRISRKYEKVHVQDTGTCKKTHTCTYVRRWITCSLVEAVESVLPLELAVDSDTVVPDDL